MNRRILVIDDEPGIREVLSIHLRQAGYVVATASSAEEGLGAAAGGDFDLAVCDFTMPDLSGAELFRSLNDASPGLAIVVISGCIDERLPADFGGCRIIAVLNKPFTKATLLEKLDGYFSTQGEKPADA